jgi:hypothetical protein
MKVDKELKFLIEKFYKLKPTQIKKLKRRTINHSFLIITNLGRYILRIYKRNITETQIKPEHKIIEFLFIIKDYQSRASFQQIMEKHTSEKMVIYLLYSNLYIVGISNILICSRLKILHNA